MGLIKCPDCGKMVSTRVIACPNCGCPSEYFDESQTGEFLNDKTQSVVRNDILVSNQHATTTRTKNNLSIQPIESLIQFKFINHFIVYPQSTKNIAKLYGKYAKMALDYSSKYINLYASAGDMHTVLTTLADQVISDIVNLEDMAAKDLYAFGISITRKDFDNKYVPLFKSEIDSLYEQYEAIKQEKDGLAYQRQIVKASRGRWQGGGFGMKGAIKGAMNAAVLNAGSDLFHSIGDSFAKSKDKKYINNKYEAIYASNSNRDNFVISSYYCFGSILEGIKREMSEYGLIDIGIFGDYDAISSLYETSIKYEGASDKLFEKMLACISSQPKELKYYVPIILDLFQQDCELEPFLNFWNLSSIYKELEGIYAKTLLENVKSPFVSRLCTFGIEIFGTPEETLGGLLVQGQVVKGNVSVDNEVTIIEDTATPIVNARVVKILSNRETVTKTKLGGKYGFLLNIRNRDSIVKGEMLVNASSFEHPESSLYAIYERDGKEVLFDFAGKYETNNNALHTFVKEDKYVSNRRMSFANSYEEIMKAYGQVSSTKFDKEKDIVLSIGKSKGWDDVSRLEYAAEYLAFSFGEQYAMRFYFDAKKELILVVYLKNIGLPQKLNDSQKDYGFELQMECSKCGRVIGTNMKFCNYCGEPNTLFMKLCPSCGKMIKKDIKFCNYCGYDFRKKSSIDVDKT